MPYSMPWGEQSDKWFSVILFVVLPFYVFYKIIKKDLPALKNVVPK